MNVFAFIPARYGSTRFPGKPLALINNKPMVQHAHQCALSCKDVTDVFVATDNQEIFNCVKGFGGRAVITEEALPSGTDRIAAAAKDLGFGDDDLIINIQGDQPFFQPETITRLIEPLKKSPEIPMSTLKYPLEGKENIANPNNVKLITDKNGFAIYFSRSPVPFYRDSNSPGKTFKHLGFYAYRMDFLQTFAGFPVGELESAEKLEQLRALENGYKIRVVESPYDSIEVDTPGDIKKAEEMIARN